MRYIIVNKPRLWLHNSLPKSWQRQVEVVSHEKWNDLVQKLGSDLSGHEFYVCNDAGYDVVAKSGLVSSNRGFSKRLCELVNDKYKARSSLLSLKFDIPFVLCQDDVVNWPHDPKDKLFAKAVGGSYASSTIKDVKHGQILPNIGEPYLIEKYIDDKHQRLAFDCYICGDQMGIITSCDNLYHQDLDEVKYYYFGMPSKYHNNQVVRRRCLEVLKEVKEATGCDNQIVDIEFFHVNGEFLVMEINPRIMYPNIPIYAQVSGVNPWEFMQNLLNGKVMEIPENTGVTGVIRHTYTFTSEPEVITHDENTFTINLPDFSHTFSTCNISQSHEDLIKQVDEKHPQADPNTPEIS